MGLGWIRINSDWILVWPNCSCKRLYRDLFAADFIASASLKRLTNFWIQSCWKATPIPNLRLSRSVCAQVRRVGKSWVKLHKGDSLVSMKVWYVSRERVTPILIFKGIPWKPERVPPKASKLEKSTQDVRVRSYGRFLNWMRNTHCRYLSQDKLKAIKCHRFKEAIRFQKCVADVLWSCYGIFGQKNCCPALWSALSNRGFFGLIDFSGMLMIRPDSP